MTLRIVSFDDGIELGAWAELEKLAENAAYSVQSGTSLLVCAFWSNCRQTYQMCRSEFPIWTSVAGRPTARRGPRLPCPV